ncbi:hypothetical protein FHW83_002881 [Duganella sp. SG902]|uniref:hypothetical protein n=1 Tax=Duganella sp. SG902 TaxID=2587016 RepID=UPI00159D578F|nr:hypothetical protein [Duganella sp. SG902]NVM77075.1 hypothetical protein [Duganella sp. SG902]
MSKINASTQFINIMVKVRPTDDPTVYKVHTAPEIPYITEADTVINYQIYDTHDLDIIFTGAIITPEDNDQLSAYTISKSGKLLTLSDANTEKMPFSVKLQFSGPHGPFSHDPQIQNDPRQ